MEISRSGFGSRGLGGYGLTLLKRRALVSGLICVLPAVVLAGAWRLGGASALEDDLIYYLPVRQYIGERIAAGEFPLWNPLTLMGTSIAADPQSGLWYPPTYLFVLLPPLVAYPVTIILHFALAGGGMYRFLRASRRDWRAALLGAIAFEFCGYLVAHRAHLTIHHAAAWLPWMLYGWRRFADTGRYRHFALASAAFGLQMLVQHIQVSIITAALLTGYVAAVLWPLRRALLWQYPLGMTIGAGVAAVQLLPTWLHLAGSTRGTASYSVFIENSWVPTSALMLLFPMLFGSRTPNLWAEPWWGISHFCEQSAYGSIAVLVLAAASLGLLRRKVSGTFSRGSWNREVIFWWCASAVALVLALGECTPKFMPVSKWLFEVPVYQNLRVPARWLLVWSVAMPVLASAVVSAMLRGGETAERVRRWVRFVAARILPAAAVVCVLAMVLARWQVDVLREAYGDRYYAENVLAGLTRAVRPGNPAIWWPLVVMAATAWVLARWSGQRRRADFALLSCVMVIDLASVAAFVDVDVRTYARADLTKPAPLVEAIRQLNPRAGDRLLVPRISADYDRPLAVLWPQTNLRHGIATFNGYGPFWPTANRLLFRFMPWGSSEAMLDLLWNRRLMQAMGIRFLAVRTQQERALLTAAMARPAAGEQAVAIPGTEQRVPVSYGHDLLWPIRIDAPGLYELSFDAEPAVGSPSRWFVRLETTAADEIGWTRTLLPTDLAMGRRRVRFVFDVRDPVGAACVRIKSEMGQALSVGRGALRLLALRHDGRDGGATAPSSLPAGGPEASGATGCATLPAGHSSEGPRQFIAAILRPWKEAATSCRGPGSFVHRADLSGGVSLYELPGAVELVYWAGRVEPAADLLDAVERLQGTLAGAESPQAAVVEGLPEAYLSSTTASPVPAGGGNQVRWHRPAGRELCIEANSQKGGLLVFNESYDPGWRATIDGQPSEILRVNAVSQGVVVPPGLHQVRFVYRPVGLAAGAGISAAAVAALLAGFLATREPRRT